MSKDKKVPLPKEVETLLDDFASEIVQDKPDDLIEYAASYFTRLSREKHGSRHPKDGEQDEEKNKAVESGKQSSQSPIDDKLGSHLPQDSKQMYRRFVPRPIQETLGYRDKRRDAIYDFTNNVESAETVVKYYHKTTEECNRIKSILQEITPFKKVDSKTLLDVIGQMRPLFVGATETIVNEGDYGYYMYVIDQGIFQAYHKEGDGQKRVKVYENEGYFGELTLLHNEPRRATVVAQTDGRLWALDRLGFRKVYMEKSTELQTKLLDLMDQVPQLKPLTEEEKWRLVDAFHMLKVKKGEIIVREGDEADGMYFIGEGAASVFQETDDGEKEVNRLGENDYFGELALLQEGTRNATVKAIEDCELAFLNVDAFERLLGPCKKLMEEHAEKYEDHRPKKKDDN